MKRSPSILILSLVLLVLFPLLGGVVGYLWRSGSAEPGFSLGTPPKPAAKIDGALTDYVVTQTASNEFFQCDLSAIRRGKDCWSQWSQIAPPTSDSISDLYSRNTVNDSWIDASRFLPPPGKIKDYWISDAFDDLSYNFTEARYALLEDGRIWAWKYKANTFTNFPQWLGGLVGVCCIGILGLLIWDVAVIVLQRVQRSSAPPT